MGKGDNRKKKHTARVARMLKAKEPKIVEDPKNTLFLRGHNTCEEVVSAMKDLYSVKKPYSKLFSRKNEILPFEDASSLEFLCDKNDCGLFLLCSHTKKRPFNLIMGRMFDGHLLDMCEFGLDGYGALSTFKGAKAAMGSKPLMLFNGDGWEMDSTLHNVQNLLIDFLHGRKVDAVTLPAIDHVISCTLNPENTMIHMRFYTVHFKSSGTRVPRVELSSMGPFLDLKVRRTRWAAPDLAKLARRIPKQAMDKKEKNVSYDIFGEKHGRLHMPSQELDKLQTRKMKGLKRNRDASLGLTESSTQETDTVNETEESENKNHSSKSVQQSSSKKARKPELKERRTRSKKLA